jgi:hypothetical protein
MFTRTISGKAVGPRTQRNELFIEWWEHWSSVRRNCTDAGGFTLSNAVNDPAPSHSWMISLVNAIAACRSAFVTGLPIVRSALNL